MSSNRDERQLADVFSRPDGEGHMLMDEKSCCQTILIMSVAIKGHEGDKL